MNKMAQVLKVFRTIHSYLGIIALPWVILFGISGLYLNHPNLITNILPASSYSDTSEQFEPIETPLTSAQAADIARLYFQGSPMKSIREIEYHGFDSIEFQRESGTIIVSKETGHYYVKNNFQNVLHSADGVVVDRKIYWNYFLGVFHRTGWFGWSIGTILADITAFALIIFGISGMTIWYIPRHRRFKRKVFGE